MGKRLSKGESLNLLRLERNHGWGVGEVYLEVFTVGKYFIHKSHSIWDFL